MKTWSNSKLSTLLMCGERFRRQHIERERAPVSLRLHRGIAVHAVAQEAHRRMRDFLSVAEAPPAGQAIVAMPKQEAIELATTEFKRIAEEREFVVEDGISRERALTEAGDFARAVASFYVTRVAPVLRPLHVEHYVKVQPRSSDIAISGKLDLVETDGTVRDLKTSEKAPNKRAADDSQQLTMYSLLFRAEFQKAPRALVLDHVVRTPSTQKLGHVPQTTVRDDRDIEILVSRLNRAIEAVEKGAFLPNTAGWWCAPKWCDYWSTCPFVANHR